MTRGHIQYRKATPADFQGILRLQRQNLLSALTGEDLSQGFLSIEFTGEQLLEIGSDLGIFVAIENTAVIGYLMAETVEFAVGSPIIAHMLTRLNAVVVMGVPLSSSRLFVHGPVCIDKQYRGRGVLEKLFRIMKEALADDYNIGVAFVSRLNSRSLKAHTEKLEMKVVDEFEFELKLYCTLAFALQ